MINVSNIERFATHDGPGIRTTIFLKGCFLQCPWCANPETWSAQSTILWDAQKCIGCRTCQTHCPNQSIQVYPSYNWKEDTCLRCGKCVEGCPSGALQMNGRWMNIEDIVKEVMKDKDYYEESHGGVTISGGEPFYQWDGFLALLQALKEQGLHVAVETTGNYSLSHLQEAMSYIDLFLFDVKHVEYTKLYEVTRADGKVIFSNLEALCKTRANDVIVRVPVIPRFNDDVLEAIIQRAESLGVKEVNLLPYHSMGKKKWQQLNKTYMYDTEPMMDKQALSKYASDFVKIGG